MDACFHKTFVKQEALLVDTDTARHGVSVSGTFISPCCQAGETLTCPSAKPSKCISDILSWVLPSEGLPTVALWD